ncbi:MAG TPA: hypothetical protein VGG57_20010 [Stellaceae bacterium]|jgi:hypothetical protein
MRRAIYVLFLSLVAIPAARAQLQGADRNLFVGSSIKGCQDGAAQEKLEIPAAQMNAFCACMANKQADMTTQADLDYYGQHRTLSSDYSKRIAGLGPACRAAAGVGK